MFLRETSNAELLIVSNETAKEVHSSNETAKEVHSSVLFFGVPQTSKEKHLTRKIVPRLSLRKRLILILQLEIMTPTNYSKET